MTSTNTPTNRINKKRLLHELDIMSKYKFGVSPTNLQDYEREILLESCEHQMKGRHDKNQRMQIIRDHVNENI